MTEHELIFEAARPRLRGLAMRILADEVAAAEVLEAVWEQWQRVPQVAEDSSCAVLVASLVRMSLLRSRRKASPPRRFASEWKLEPSSSVPIVTQEQLKDRADDVSTSLLLLLEELSPVERMVLLMRKVFGLGYFDIAARLGMTESECRNVAERASTRLANQVRRGRQQ